MKWLALTALALSGAALAGPNYDFLFETGDRYGVIYTVRRGVLEKTRVARPSPRRIRRAFTCTTRWPTAFAK